LEWNLIIVNTRLSGIALITHKKGYYMKAVVLEGKKKVVTVDVPDPKIESPSDVIVKITTAGICGSDLHMYDGRAPITPGTVLGHENMGIVQEVGTSVVSIKQGDRVVLPFNISCGFCFNCRRSYFNACLTTNPNAAGAGYGYAGLGPYRGGQAELLRVPFADFNCIRLPGTEGDELEDEFLLLSDIFPTAWHATELARVKYGEPVAVFGAGPVGLLSAYSAKIKGASEVYIVDRSKERLKKAESIGAIPVNIENGEPSAQIFELRKKSKQKLSMRQEESKMPGVMSAIDAVGYQAFDDNQPSNENPAENIRQIAKVINPTGSVGIIGVWFNSETNAQGEYARKGEYLFPIGEFWYKGVSIGTGQAPVKKYSEHLRNLIMSGVARPSFIVSHRIGLNKAPEAYRLFDMRGEGEGAAYTKVLLKPSLDKR
jgi:glutathione-independent formaldehyde dehydrogenase